MTPKRQVNFDVFICHASEDKNDVVRPLAGHLLRQGYEVWFDEFAMKLGDSLRRSIDRGLSSCRYGVVVLSTSFFAKNWPQYELDGLVQRENAEGVKVILPVWHEVTREQVSAYSPTLADRIAVLTTSGLETMCLKISEAVGPPKLRGQPQHIQQRDTSHASGVCSRCGKQGEVYGYDGSDGDEFHWFECPHCGHFASRTMNLGRDDASISRFYQQKDKQ